MRRTKRLVRAAAIAAVYAALSFVSSLAGLAFGPVQLRLSEALCVLPFAFPEAAGGLFVGCLLTNLLSPYGPLDVVIGSAATLLAALWTIRLHRRVLAPLPAILCNGLCIGGLLAWYEAGFSDAFPAVFAYHALTVAAGEALCAYALGLPLLAFARRWDRR